MNVDAWPHLSLAVWCKHTYLGSIVYGISRFRPKLSEMVMSESLIDVAAVKADVCESEK